MLKMSRYFAENYFCEVIHIFIFSKVIDYAILQSLGDNAIKRMNNLVESCEVIAQRAQDAESNFEQAQRKGDMDTMNAIIDHLHFTGMSGLAESLQKSV